MDLTYRGRRYTTPAASTRSYDGAWNGYYRGLPWHRHEVRAIPHTPQELSYRGVPYSVNRKGQVMPSSRPRKAAPTWALTARASTHRVTEVAVRHHEALVSRLEARMAIARNQGNTQLLQDLESERQQLA
ncbi:MAG: DUF4278 domain-containing protein [Cyanophyceae cyanobacterium]